jgi:GNAT superfamily N-acetyltransferase
MSTRIIAKPVHALTRKEYGQCRRLTLGEEGLLRDNLEYHYKYMRELPVLPKGYASPKVLLLREIESAKLLAWCLFDDLHGVMLYVHSKHRRKKLGTRLMRKVMRLQPQAEVSPHDDCSRAFFSHLQQQRSLQFNIRRGYSLDEE